MLLSIDLDRYLESRPKTELKNDKTVNKQKFRPDNLDLQECLKCAILPDSMVHKYLFANK